MAVKRLTIVSLIIGLAVVVGLPVWWHLTSIQRPRFPPETVHRFRAAWEAVRPLPVHLHVHLFLGDISDADWPPHDFFSLEASAHSAITTLQAEAEEHGSATLQGTVFPASALRKNPGKGCLLASHTLTYAGGLTTIRCESSSSTGATHAGGSPAAAEAAGTQPKCPPRHEPGGAVAQDIRAAAANMPPLPGHFHVFLVVGSTTSCPPASGPDGVARAGDLPYVSVDRAAWYFVPSAQPDSGAAPQAGVKSAVVAIGRHVLGAGVAAGAAAGTSPLPLSPASEVTARFVLALEAPHELAGWEFETWSEALWEPLAARLSPLLSLQVETRVVPYARQRQEQPPGTPVPLSDLPYFVDSDSWSLNFGRTTAGHPHPLSRDAHGVPETILNFVCFVPRRARQPLTIASQRPSARTPAFIVPGWGGVTITNAVAPPGAGAELPAADMAAFLGSAAHQFRQLVGLPEVDGVGGGVAFEEEGIEVVRGWELDGLMRVRFLELMLECKDTAVTLVHLVNTLPNLEIPSLVGTEVQAAQAQLETALRGAAAGDYQEALSAARAARRHLEVAVSHHSISSQHNYPEQHKVAVYLPLFAPLAIPMLSVAVQEYRRAFMLRWRSFRKVGS